MKNERGYIAKAIASDWETPDDLFSEYNRTYKFQIDAAASLHNTKCKKYWSIKDDAIQQDWKKYHSIWCNPPYGKMIRSFVEKAYHASFSGTTTVMLLPARTDVRWFHEFCYEKGSAIQIIFLKGRLKFKGAKASAPFPSMIVIFKGIKR